jgi:hypothetical protein
MQPHGVVIDAPRFNGLLRLGNAEKPVLVQALVAKLAVETLDVRVLNRLAGANKARLDALAIGLLVHAISVDHGAT